MLLSLRRINGIFSGKKEKFLVCSQKVFSKVEDCTIYNVGVFACYKTLISFYPSYFDELAYYFEGCVIIYIFVEDLTFYIILLQKR